MSFVFGVSPPRSGTAWLSNFLTWGESHFMHEALFGASTLDSLERRLLTIKAGTMASIVGSFDTAASLVIPALYERFPDSKYILVHREKEAVQRSMLRMGMDFDLPVVYEGIQWASENINQDQLIVLDYRTMFTLPEMKKVWEFIEHPQTFPFDRMEMLRGLYVEDGMRTGFGRFVDADVVEENILKFQNLIKSCGSKATYKVMTSERRVSMH